MRECFVFCEEQNISESIVEMQIIKSFMTDLAPYFGQLRFLSREDAEDRLSYIGDLIRDCRIADHKEHLPAPVKQIIEEIEKGDIDRIIRIANYGEKGHLSSPLIYGADGIKMMLPEELFDPCESDAKVELKDALPVVMVNRGEIVDDKLALFGHIFFERVQACEEYPQKIEAFLIDSKRNKTIQLDAYIEDTYYLSRRQGLSICLWNNESYKYDYSRCGFGIVIDPDKLDKEIEPESELSLHIKYSNAVIDGAVPARGVVGETRNVIKKWEHKSVKDRTTCFIDKGGVIFIKKEEIDGGNKGNKEGKKKQMSIPIGKKYAISLIKKK